MATKHQKVAIKIGKGFNARQRKKIAAELIDVMIDNAVDNTGFYDGKRRSFPKYSKKYFKYGEAVDLTLSGEMLDAIQLLQDKEDELVIGFQNGTKANAKADGNIRGTYGKSRANPRKARPFLGVTADELDDVLTEFSRKES